MFLNVRLPVRYRVKECIKYECWEKNKYVHMINRTEVHHLQGDCDGNKCAHTQAMHV